jgi:hypothetical protein
VRIKACGDAFILLTGRGRGSAYTYAVVQGYLVQVKSALDRQQLVLSAEFDDGSARRVMVLSAQVLYRVAHQTIQQHVLYSLFQEGGGPGRTEPTLGSWQALLTITGLPSMSDYRRMSSCKETLKKVYELPRRSMQPLAVP